MYDYGKKESQVADKHSRTFLSWTASGGHVGRVHLLTEEGAFWRATWPEAHIARYDRETEVDKQDR
jgi:hypothetical protein